MVWSNWQGAAWRGAIVVVLIWSGLAWTQAPVQTPGDPADRIMVVHENGRKIRCRVEETWQLPDGRVAHLLQALESGERITIVDDQAAPTDPTIKNPRAMPKRIFAWGEGRKTPPEGSPLPPHFRIDSGIVITQNAAPPSGYQIASAGKIGDVQVLDLQKATTTAPNIIQVAGTQSTSDVKVIQASDPNDKNTPSVIQIGDTPPLGVPSGPIAIPTPLAAPAMTVPQIPATPSVPLPVPGTPAPTANVPPIPLAPSGPIAMPSVSAVPTINVTQAPIVPSTPSPAPVAPAAPATAVVQSPGATCANPPVYIVDDPSMTRPWRPGDKIMDWLQNRNGPIVMKEIPAPSVPGAIAQPTVPSSVVAGPLPPVVGDVKIVQDKAPEPEKRPWRPGDRIIGFFTGKPPATTPKTETLRVTETTKLDLPPPLPRSGDDLKIQKTEDYLATENKQLEKKLQEKVANAPPGAFSTAMALQPDVKKSDTPLSIPTAPARTDANKEKTAVLPPPLPGDVKQAAGPTAEKKDMWGIGLADSVLPPGKSVVEGAVKPTEIGAVPPLTQTRVNDPLAMPERFVDKRSMLGPVAMDTMPGDAPPGGYPLGAQSVIAARSGMLGQITYVPVPTVTVPQPFNPPTPPEPKMPSPPQLNAYVNAFTPPPQPKGTEEYVPMQGMMPAQAMNPALQQQMAMQQYMMQQQMMQQQMMQQQALNANGYRPNPYPPMVSQGPTMNFARQYMGPQAPNPVGPGPVMPAGYAPMPYPPMQPQPQPIAPQQQPLMPQQQPMQQVGFQQPNAALSQVDQLLKVLRESPYPAQREWAAQSLTSFEWRTHPHILPGLLQSASQDPAGSVRAGCVFSLGRMQAAVEPVFTTLNAMRNDIDPRVRQEVQQTLVRLGRAPMSGN